MKRFFLAFLGAHLIATSPLAADGLPQPLGEVLLKVTGDLTLTNDNSSAYFDLDMLKALGVTSFKTSTVWTEGKTEFSGVSLQALVEKLGITAPVLTMHAVNDYAVDVPLSDAVPNGPIIAFAIDEKPMTVRDKGPLWLVYPYDLNQDYQTETIFSRSIWQLVSIEPKK
jgi:hypothetical protein